MATIDNRLFVCDCCALKVANDDTSSCKDYYGHEHMPASQLPASAVLTGDPKEWWGRFAWNCDGCGDDYLPGSNKWEVVTYA